MVEWLKNFDGNSNRLVANVVGPTGAIQMTEMGELCTRGAPSGFEKARQRAFATCFDDWSVTPATRYLEAFAGLEDVQGQHVVYSFKHGWFEYLVPALVVARALFPLIADAFQYAFTPRNLEVLCFPVERRGHWSVIMPNFKGVYKARFRRSTVEALTWASLYPSAHQAWRSIFDFASLGIVGVKLPRATVSLLAYGLRSGRTVHVTKLSVNALQPHEEPFAFASGAPSSFVMNSNAQPLTSHPNTYFEQMDEGHEHVVHRLTDDEWQHLKGFTERKKAPRGRQPRDDVRDIADGLLIRVATGSPWQNIPVPIAGDALSRHWAAWRADGRLANLCKVMVRLRPDTASEWVAQIAATN